MSTENRFPGVIAAELAAKLQQSRAMLAMLPAPAREALTLSAEFMHSASATLGDYATCLVDLAERLELLEEMHGIEPADQVEQQPS